MLFFIFFFKLASPGWRRRAQPPHAPHILGHAPHGSRPPLVAHQQEAKGQGVDFLFPPYAACTGKAFATNLKMIGIAASAAAAQARRAAGPKLMIRLAGRAQGRGAAAAATAAVVTVYVVAVSFAVGVTVGPLVVGGEEGDGVGLRRVRLIFI